MPKHGNVSSQNYAWNLPRWYLRSKGGASPNCKPVAAEVQRRWRVQGEKVSAAAGDAANAETQ